MRDRLIAGLDLQAVLVDARQFDHGGEIIAFRAAALSSIIGGEADMQRRAEIRRSWDRRTLVAFGREELWEGNFPTESIVIRYHSRRTFFRLCCQAGAGKRCVSQIDGGNGPLGVASASVAVPYIGPIE
jgi:hypothetical protein